MSASGVTLSLFTLRGLLPATTLSQVRGNLRLGIVLRWVTIAMVGVAGMLSPRVPPFLLGLLAVVTLYNAVIWLVVARAPVAWWRRVALAITVLDQLVLFSFLPIYGSVVPGGEAVAGYLIGTIEAVTYFGASGAALSVGLFLGCAVTFQAVDPPLFHRAFNSTGVPGAVLMISLVAAVLVAAMRTLISPADAEPAVAGYEPAPGHARLAEPAAVLSRREQEVLRLVAEGYSNTMIATRLRLSDTTVKSYVENLLLRLNVRNRAEAVAVASRQGLL